MAKAKNNGAFKATVVIPNRYVLQNGNGVTLLEIPPTARDLWGYRFWYPIKLIKTNPKDKSTVLILFNQNTKFRLENSSDRHTCHDIYTMGAAEFRELFNNKYI